MSFTERRSALVKGLGTVALWAMNLSWLTIPILFAAVLGPCWAQDAAPDPFAPPPLSTKIWDDPSLSNLSSKAHKALGYATVTLGIATGFLAYADPGSRNGEGAHHLLGELAAFAAGGTLLAGLVAHWKDLRFSQDWVTWNNLHALAGVAGASLIITAAVLGGKSPHAWIGAAGTGLMALAIVLEG